ncbi:MAG: ABC transporter permease subunit, partial [Caldilinea sp.]|nr:ABC transporter permease subunit [Caldilinea sp.]MDW8442761.1 ABC transporter permease subunit [Caldilineaceae bacterium]
MNRRAIRAVVRRDLLSVTRSKGVMIPLILVPPILMIVLPTVVSLVMPASIKTPGFELGGMGQFLDPMPAGLKAQFANYTPEQQMIAYALLYLFAPLFLVMPLMVSTVIAADSFAGEKERKTLEALLYTPTTDLELFIGKLLSAWLPAVAVSLLSFVLYGVTANLVAWPIMQRIFFPNAMWLVLVFWVTPAAAAVGMGATMLVSSRVNSFQEAYQISGVAVVPIVLLVIVQALGVIYLSVTLTMFLGLVI